MRLTPLDWSIVAAYFTFQSGSRLLLQGAGWKKHRRVFPGGTECSLVAGWDFDGRHDFRGRYAASGYGNGRPKRIAGNWLWWNFVASGMLTVFFFSRLWRRSGVMTDVEFAEIRYAGKPAAFLRGFRAIYLGIPINCIILGWVNLAMVKILMLIIGVTQTGSPGDCPGDDRDHFLHFDFWPDSGACWVTDLFQFVVKMGMVIALAVAAVSAVGGIDRMKSKLAEIDRARGLASGGAGSVLSFVPDLNSAWMPMLTFLVYISVVWWATWYPGAEPGGGGYVAQRMFSAKDERHSLLATLWFNVATFALRPLALDTGRAGLDDPLSRPAGQRKRLCAGHDRPFARVRSEV